MAKQKHQIKEIPISYVEATDEVVAKYKYRDYTILVKSYTKYNDYTDTYTGEVFDKDLNETDYFEETYSIDDIKNGAIGYIDNIAERPARAREALKECDTKRLKDIFYSYASSAPAWADEVMEMVAESKLRKWLVNKIIDMLTDNELIEEMGVD